MTRAEGEGCELINRGPVRETQVACAARSVCEGLVADGATQAVSNRDAHRVHTRYATEAQACTGAHTGKMILKRE